MVKAPTRVFLFERIISSSALQRDEKAPKKSNRKMKQIRQWKKHWECFQVEKGKLKDKLFSVFTFLLSYLENKDQLPSITSENSFVAGLRLERLRWGEGTS